MVAVAESSPVGGHRIHTSGSGGFILHAHSPSPRPPLVPAPERGSRGPASVLAAAPDRGPGQASAVRPLLRRLRLHHESGLGPRLRGDDPRFREGRRLGANARAARTAGAETSRNEMCACGSLWEEGAGWIMGMGCFRSARVHPALRSGIGDPLPRAFACGRGRVSAPARFARLIARTRGGRRTHFACRLNRGRSAPDQRGRDAACHGMSYLLTLCHGSSGGRLPGGRRERWRGRWWAWGAAAPFVRLAFDRAGPAWERPFTARICVRARAGVGAGAVRAPDCARDGCRTHLACRLNRGRSACAPTRLRTPPPSVMPGRPLREAQDRLFRHTRTRSGYPCGRPGRSGGGRCPEQVRA